MSWLTRGFGILASGWAVCLASSVPFGRFGYTTDPGVSGIRLSREGFQSSDQPGSRIRFPGGLSEWKLTDVSSFGETILVGDKPGCPSKLRVSLFSPGFWMYFPKGIRLAVASTGAPYLSWQDGSVSKDVPTPDVRWAVLSFQDKEVPFVLGFPTAPCSLKVTGKPANWVIASADDYKGWVHVGLPIGSRAVSANSAASLGSLTESMRVQAGLYTEPAPELKVITAQADDLSVTATYAFDRVGAVVPVAAILAPLARYPLRVLSKVEAIPAPTSDGPLVVAKEKVIRIRLPIRRLPSGRALATGEPGQPAVGTISPDDVASVFDLAIENLLASRDAQARKVAEDSLTEFLANAPLVAEPNTGQTLPYHADGTGLDLVAAHALLMQSLTPTASSASEANSLLTSLSWRTDAARWTIVSPSDDLSRRAAAIASVAGTLCPEPERRLAAAQWQAGLAGQRGLGLWRRRQGFSSAAPTWLEPISGIRDGIFGMPMVASEARRFVDVLASPVRIFGELAVSVSGVQSPYVVTWAAVEVKPSVLTLSSAYPLRFTARTNLDRLKVDRSGAEYEVQMIPSLAGPVQFDLTVPVSLPVRGAVPQYVEVRQ